MRQSTGVQRRLVRRRDPTTGERQITDGKTHSHGTVGRDVQSPDTVRETREWRRPRIDARGLR